MMEGSLFCFVVMRSCSWCLWKALDEEEGSLFSFVVMRSCSLVSLENSG